MNRRCLMSLRHLLPAIVVVLAVAPPADAWKVTTHMVAATKAVKQVDDADLRAVLESNVAAVRGRAVGPDVIYFTASFAQTLGAGVGAYKDRTAFSDMAHYCKTDQLAKNMIDLAEATPRSRPSAMAGSPTTSRTP